jgi:ABC-type Fe3+ transport system substrate-binding protein
MALRTTPIVKPLVLAVCAAILTAGPAAPAEPAGASAEWERLVKAAEQEGQVNVYAISQDAEWRAFQQRFPKIKVVLVHGSASQTLQRIMAERRAGKFVADIVRLGGGTSTSLYRAKALDPLAPALILPEVKDLTKWFEGTHYYNDPENQFNFIYAAFPLRLLGYNSNRVDPAAITSFQDLLDPKWKGKITMKDPREPGGGSPLLFLYHNPRLGPEFIKKLVAAGNLTLVRDERQQTDWLGSGQFPLAITAKADGVDEARKQGLPVDVLDAHALKEGAGLEAGGTMISLANRAPHPNAAKLLINWFLSREGQMVAQKGSGSEHGPNSLREDIPKEMIPPGLRRQAGVKYVRLWGPQVWDRTPIRDLVSEVVK